MAFSSVLTIVTSILSLTCAQYIVLVDGVFGYVYAYDFYFQFYLTLLCQLFYFLLFSVDGDRFDGVFGCFYVHHFYLQVHLTLQCQLFFTFYGHRLVNGVFECFNDYDFYFSSNSTFRSIAYFLDIGADGMGLVSGMSRLLFLF